MRIRNPLRLDGLFATLSPVLDLPGAPADGPCQSRGNCNGRYFSGPLPGV